MITFNVLFIPGSVARLLPFALSLLQGSGARIRVVANGCRPDEVDLMRAATRVDERVSHHVLPQRGPIPHGQALNHLFEVFDEPYFAIADSDVIAAGDFMDSLAPIPPGTALFSGTPVWATDDEAVCPPGARFLTGRQRVLHDGTPVGSSYVAIYERAAIEPLWRQAPRGFGATFHYSLPRPMRDSLSARGWRFQIVDSCRLVNLLLLVNGSRLENRPVPELHHLGGYSGRAFKSSRVRLRSLLRSRDDRWLQRIVESALLTLHARLRRDPERSRMDERRRIVLPYVDAVLDAILADRPRPPAPRTDSADVDRRVAALGSALEGHYRPGLSALSEATRGSA